MTSLGKGASWCLRTFAHAVWMTAVGILLIVGVRTNAQTVDLETKPPAQQQVQVGPTAQERLDRGVARVMREQREQGLVCRRAARDGAVPVVVVQHRATDRGHTEAGAQTVRAYDAETAFEQADLENHGQDATHWSDAFCYAD